MEWVGCYVLLGREGSSQPKAYHLCRWGSLMVLQQKANLEKSAAPRSHGGVAVLSKKHEQAVHISSGKVCIFKRSRWQHI